MKIGLFSFQIDMNEMWISEKWWTKPANKQQPQPHEILQLPFHYRPDANEKIAEYYKTGLSLSEIAKRGGGNKTKISSTLRRSGVEIRNFRKG